MATKAKKLTEKDVTFTLECLHEDTAYVGNASAIDAATDRETEAWIARELRAGNDWAWCCVKVTARYGSLTAVNYLGCCSYESEANFIACGTYDDMKADTLSLLQQRVNELALLVCACEA